MEQIFNRLYQIGKLVIVTGILIVGFGSLSEISAEKDYYNSPQSLLGNYLAGRYASSLRDTKAAAYYFEKALRHSSDNKKLLEQAFLLEIMSANWARSSQLSKQLIQIDPSHSFARLFRGVESFRRSDFVAAEAHLLAGSDGPVGVLISQISRSWILATGGKYSAALEKIGKKSKTSWVNYYRQYHMALIADHGGVRKVARKKYKDLFAKFNRMVRLTQNYASFLYRSGDKKGAMAVLTTHFSKSHYVHPDLRSLQNQIKQGLAVEPVIGNARQGLAELFFSLGDLRSEGGGEDDGLLFLQIARYLNPNFVAADYALANLLYKLHKYSHVIAILNNIKPGSPIDVEITILKARALSATDQTEAAIGILEAVAMKNNSDPELYNALGKLYLDQEKYHSAIKHYSKGITLLKQLKNEHWFYFYGRGISYERLKVWAKAEKDFKQALKLSPDQADVLNYLGYSWVDQKLNLSQAMKLIRKAVKLKPQSGYYVDSLGWAHYQLHNFHKAVMFLEKAVELKPDDPVINDHLGDVYWRLGRHLEAKYQWKQVLSLKPEDVLKKNIIIKLQTGLSEKRQAKIIKTSK